MFDGLRIGMILRKELTVDKYYGIRIVKKENNNYTCNCDFYMEHGACSHIIATINLNLIKE